MTKNEQVQAGYQPNPIIKKLLTVEVETVVDGLNELVESLQRAITTTQGFSKRIEIHLKRRSGEMTDNTLIGKMEITAGFNQEEPTPPGEE